VDLLYIMDSMKKVLFVSSAGGHLAQLLQFKSLFHNYNYLLVTEYIPSNQDLGELYTVSFVKKRRGGRGLGFWLDFISNSVIAFKIMWQHNPDVVVSTGSYIAIPFLIFSKIFRAKSIFLLSYARVNSRAKSADVAYYLADVFIVQWESALKNYRRGVFLDGGIY